MSLITLIKQVTIGQFMLHCDGGGGGDGGAGERKAAEDKRIAEAVNKINLVMGNANATPAEVDRNAFVIKRTSEDGGGSRYYGKLGGNKDKTLHDKFDQAGYDAALAKAQQDAYASKAAYGERAKLYDTIKTDANQRALIDLNKERDITERNLGFDVARQGLSGGSHDIDTMRQLSDTYQQGVMKASELSSSTANNARAADDKTRAGLITSIRSGLDSGSATNQAYSEMRNNSDRATADTNALTLTGFFDRLNNLNQQRKYNNGVAAGSAAPGTTAPGTTQPKPDSGSIKNF